MSTIKTKDDCPCIDCACIPICQNRRYIHLLDICTLWKDYVGYINDHMGNKTMDIHRKRFLKVRDVLKPKRWFIHREDDRLGYMIQTIPEGANRDDPKYQITL